MLLRRANQEDVGAVVAVLERARAGMAYLPVLHTHAEHIVYFGRAIRDHEAWVAEEGGRVVGFGVLSDELLEHLYVDPDAQGRGVGSALLEQAKRRRPDGFRLWVFQANDGARRFYERHGCVVVKLTDGADNEEREPDALYEWRPG